MSFSVLSKLCGLRTAGVRLLLLLSMLLISPIVIGCAALEPLLFPKDVPKNIPSEPPTGAPTNVPTDVPKDIPQLQGEAFLSGNVLVLEKYECDGKNEASAFIYTGTVIDDSDAGAVKVNLEDRILSRYIPALSGIGRY